MKKDVPHFSYQDIAFARAFQARDRMDEAGPISFAQSFDGAMAVVGNSATLQKRRLVGRELTMTLDAI